MYGKNDAATTRKYEGKADIFGLALFVVHD